MAIKTKKELIEQVQKVIGDSADDHAIELLEDVTDTLNSFTDETMVSKSEMDNEVNKWKQKYIDRFNNPGVTDTPKAKEEKHDEEEHEVTFEDLFTDKKK